MKTYPIKNCRHCGGEFRPTGANSVFCGSKCKYLDRRQQYRDDRAAVGNPVGKSGGNYGRTGKDHWAFKHGVDVFKKVLSPAIRNERGDCERCGKDLRNSASAFWCVHHKDHDRTNNQPENLELLCKRCHQVEHKCWEAFKS